MEIKNKMYIYCKKDFNKINFKFEKGIKYPITNVYSDIYCFVNPENGCFETISILLEE
jgi:hypothetical protein